MSKTKSKLNLPRAPMAPPRRVHVPKPDRKQKHKLDFLSEAVDELESEAENELLDLFDFDEAED